jgi:hypothetical protein
MLLYKLRLSICRVILHQLVYLLELKLPFLRLWSKFVGHIRCEVELSGLTKQPFLFL